MNADVLKKKEASSKKVLNSKQLTNLLDILKARFEKNMERHKGVEWRSVQTKLEANTEKLFSLLQMESTGGEPDIVGYYKKTKEFVFCDCSLESPEGRRSLCYDKESLESRKEHKPKNNVVDMAGEMGVEILSEKEYRDLQNLFAFDLNTSSWVKTPSEIRKLGGALFCDRRYDNVFVYHNGASSYYSSRGFRSLLRI